MSDIDTSVQHVSKAGVNLLSELGFSPEQARCYQKESDERINSTLALKEQLMDELAAWIDEHHLNQDEAAEIFHITRPRVSDMVNKKTTKFSIDALVGMLARIGKLVKLVIA